MKQLILLFAATMVNLSMAAQNGDPKKIEILLLGTFHFANPGLDVAKFEDANILSEKRQKEIEDLVAKLKQFKPRKIFIEAPVSFQKKYDSLLTAYINGTHNLAANETQQLGFRLAKESGLTRLHCIDYTDISFPMDSAIKVMIGNRQMNMIQYFQEAIQKEQNNFNEQLKTKTITQLLVDGNTEDIYDKLAGMYYFFLEAGDKNNHIGSFLASEQWRRNIYIYENILKTLDYKEERVLVLYGTTHIAMLREMMKYNQNLKIVPLKEFLK